MTGKTNEKLTKKEIQKEISKKFENPENTVKDYYEYIQRAINETGNFDSNMKKAHEYYPSRSTDKMKAAYKNTKVFSVIDVPKVVSQKNDKAVVSSKVKQIEVVKKDGKDTEVTKTMTVTYNLTANKDGQWVITSNQVKVE
jgi:intergrase/recombinase